MSRSVPSYTQLVGEVRKTVTVVFADVASSTGLGERLDPEALRRVMGRYFDEARGVLERHGGTVEKFIGDAVMAVFGVPVLHEDDALRAVRAAAGLPAALARLNDELRASHGVELGIRVGVNTGEVVADEEGGSQRLVTGDAIVVAKRLEETAPPGQVQLGEATFRLVRDAVEAEPVEAVDAKGKPALRAWRLLRAPPDAQPLRLRLDSPLVGRELDLAALEETYERAVEGAECRLFTVLGPAGIGKSRLTHEFVERLGDRALVLRGRCLPYGDGVTFWPLVEVVRQAAELADQDTAEQAREKIAALVPGEEAAVVSDRVAAAIGRGEAAAARPEETFWAVRRFLEALAAKRPVVVVFDDIHWGEATFLDLIEYLAGWSTGAPILILCLARAELMETRPSWSLPRRRSAAILLEPLGRDRAAALVENFLGAAPDEDVAALVERSAEGNPLFLEELLRLLLEEGVLTRAGGRWRATGDLGRVRVPPSVQALLSARLDRLEPAERAVVQRAAVVGEVFWWGAVAELSPEGDRGSVGACLQALVRKDLIRHEPSALAGEDAFRFGHILMRDAAYAALPKETRGELHERLAYWLERRAGEGSAEYAELVGHHLEQAFRYRAELGPVRERELELAARAADRLAAAGARASARGDIPAAAALLERAVALLPEGDARRVTLAPELGRVLKERGDVARAREVLAAAVGEAARSADRAAEARARLELASLKLHTDPSASAGEAEDEARSTIPVFEELEDDVGLARAWLLIAAVLWFRCRFGPMEEVLERALAYAERGGDRREQARILSGLARAAVVGPRPVPEAIARCEEILARLPGDRLAEAELSALLSTLHAMEGRFDEARALYRRSTRLLDEHGRTLLAASNAAYSGLVEQFAGDLDAAEGELRHAYAELLRMGHTGFLSTIAAELGRVLELRHRFEEAQHLTVVSERAAAPEDLVSQVAWRGVRARLLARRNAFPRAEEVVEQAVRLAEQTDYVDLQGLAHFDRAFVLRAAGRPGEAEQALRRALERWEAKGDLVMAERARSVLAGLAARAHS